MIEQLEKQVESYFPILKEKLGEIGIDNAEVIFVDTVTTFSMFCKIFDDVLSLYKEVAGQYVQLEELLQKSESECRNHIRIEQRLKIHCENLQEIYEELQKQELDYKQIIQSQEKEILQLKREVMNVSKADRIEIGRTTSMIDKLVIDQQKTYDLKGKQILQINNINTLKKNQIQLRINRKKRLVTEQYDNNQTITKQSMDERQYSSLEKIKDISQIYSRPKSRHFQENKQKSITLHVQSLHYNNIRSKSQIKK